MRKMFCGAFSTLIYPFLQHIRMEQTHKEAHTFNPVISLKKKIESKSGIYEDILSGIQQYDK